MAITFDTVTSSTLNSFTHTCTGVNLALTIGVFSSTDNVSAVSYNGVAMTLLTKIASPTAEEVYYYYLLNPATGANTVAITGGTGITVRSVSYTGVSQTIFPDASGTATSSIATVSKAIVTVADNAWMTAFMRNDSDFSDSNGGSATVKRGADSSIAYFDSNGVLTPPASYTGSFKTRGAGTANWALIVASLTPFGASATLSAHRGLLGVGI